MSDYLTIAAILIGCLVCVTLYFETNIIGSVPVLRADSTSVALLPPEIKWMHTKSKLEIMGEEIERMNAFNINQTYSKVDVYYNCDENTKNMFPKQDQKPLNNKTLFKGQEGEDVYVYNHFFNPEVRYTSRYETNYFVELGALDGIRFSNSYYFEKELSWGGVLIEGETLNYVKLEENRMGEEVVTVHAGICKDPTILHLFGTGPMAAKEVVENMPSAQKTRRTSVICLPMQDLLNQHPAMDHIDFYSIDIEGAELDVVTTHDWDSMPVGVVVIEMRPVDEHSNPSVRRALHSNGLCRFDDNVGHSNEAWINPEYFIPKIKK